MEEMRSLDTLSLREKKKYSDIPENWKLKPVCCLSDISEKEIYYAATESPGGTPLAAFRKVPAFIIYIINKKGEEVLSIKKQTGLFSNYKLEVFDASENLIGSIQKQASSKTHFQVFDVGGNLAYTIEGPVVAPEIFHIRRSGDNVGKISKRPTAAAEAGTSQNDHFGIVFPFAADPVEKGVLLGALFLIDLTFSEPVHPVAPKIAAK